MTTDKLIRLVLPWPPTSGNNQTRAGRGRVYTTDEIKTYRYIIWSMWMRDGKPVIEVPVSLSWYLSPPNLREYDFENYSKVIKDAISAPRSKKAGVNGRALYLLGDSNKHIPRESVVWGVPVKGGRAVVEVLPL